MTFQLASTQLSVASAYQTSLANAQEAAVIATYADLFTQITTVAGTGLTSLNYATLPLGDQATIIKLLIKYGYKAAVVNNVLVVDWATAQPVNVVVANPVVGFSVTTFNGAVSAPLNIEIKSLGGVAPYTFTYIGNIPTGCAITATSTAFVVSGTPTTASTQYSAFTLTVTDSTFPVPQSITKDVSWSIGAAAAAVVYPITALNKTSFAGTTGVLLTVVLKPVGGVAPYTFQLVGNVPNACTYSTSSTSLTINGAPDTPTVKYAVLTVTVTDSKNYSFSQDIDYTIAAGPVTNLSAAPGSSYIGALSLLL